MLKLVEEKKPENLNRPNIKYTEMPIEALPC